MTSPPIDQEMTTTVVNKPTVASDKNVLKAHGLTTFIHPTHDGLSTPPQSDDESAGNIQDLFSRACSDLSISVDMIQPLLELYFDNMMAYSIFHQPSFTTKLLNIKNLGHLKALLAAIFSFSARYQNPQQSESFQAMGKQSADQIPEHRRFHKLALKFIDQAIEECADDTPPLCVLQAMVLASFYQITESVRGRAWRSLGACVRVAYELSLHLIDFDLSEEGADDQHDEDDDDGTTAAAAATATATTDMELDHEKWAKDEEKRRTWWAIWEMDTFVSTIRRAPVAIDWSKMRTCLPVADEFWFNNCPRRSCFLRAKPVERVKALQNSGNESPVAWNILITSLMRDAQPFSNFNGGLRFTDPAKYCKSVNDEKNERRAKTLSEEDLEKLQILMNTLKCVNLSLPEAIRDEGKFLSFTSTDVALVKQARQAHCAIYSTCFSLQLARFMTYHRFAFKEIAAGETLNAGSESPQANPGKQDYQGTANCLDAAERVLDLVNRCSNDHVRYVNPFLASTVWIAAALQLVVKTFGPPRTNKDLIDSKLEVLRSSFRAFARFWEMSPILEHNLELLEHRLQTGGITPTSRDQWPRSGEKLCHKSQGSSVQRTNMDVTDPSSGENLQQVTRYSPHANVDASTLSSTSMFDEAGVPTPRMSAPWHITKTNELSINGVPYNSTMTISVPGEPLSGDDSHGDLSMPFGSDDGSKSTDVYFDNLPTETYLSGYVSGIIYDSLLG